MLKALCAPAHAPLKAGFSKFSENRSGLKASGSFHKCGEWCRFHTLMKMSAPLPMGYLRAWRGWHTLMDYGTR